MSAKESANVDTGARYNKVPRAELIAALVKRDGTKCQHPDCDNELDFAITSGTKEVTIDHHIPQWYCKEQGWSMDKIWDLSNLKLFEKRCNAKKGDLIPNADGTLPPKPQSTFRFRRQKRAERPEICTSCSAGRDLGPDEVCASCNSGPMPHRYPRWAKVRSSECDHELFWCAWCSIGVIPRVSAASVAILQGESGEWE